MSVVSFRRMMPRHPTRREFLQLGATAVLAPGLVLPAGAAADPSRLALVVGNDAYPGAPLGNAVNDAKAMAGCSARRGSASTCARTRTGAR
ncbi:MAG: caspase family protein [Betaproteobacteria bacterium]|nr:caspase family protein [Betaproteobacteria bacterium]